jgi:hypothetical protein
MKERTGERGRKGDNTEGNEKMKGRKERRRRV